MLFISIIDVFIQRYKYFCAPRAYMQITFRQLKSAFVKFTHKANVHVLLIKLKQHLKYDVAAAVSIAYCKRLIIGVVLQWYCINQLWVWNGKKTSLLNGHAATFIKRHGMIEYIFKRKLTCNNTIIAYTIDSLCC